MHRPLRILALPPAAPAGSGGSNPPYWDSGLYTFDGAGNVKAIGTQRFAYDVAGRLVHAEVVPQANGGTAADVEEYTYDPFGNLLARTLTPGPGRVRPDGEAKRVVADAATNRLLGTAVVDASGAQLFDASGNARHAADFAHDPNGAAVRFPGRAGFLGGARWDELGRMTEYVQGDPWTAGGTPAERYRYDAGNYRWLRTTWAGRTTLSLRDAQGQPLAEYVAGRAADGTATYALDREYVRGLGRVLAERRWTGSAFETTYQMRDHLGSLRIVTDAA
ncbi:hypothetical protein LLG88_15955, partial [bacterium]|nr:hypothetical protein [bacterium]